MSEYQGNFHEIVKALRDAIPSSDMSYKDLNLGIILNHLYTISRNNPAFSDNDEKLLRHLMEEHDPETLAEWEPECFLCFYKAESSEHKIDDQVVCNYCWDKEQAEIKVANEPLEEERNKQQ